MQARPDIDPRLRQTKLVCTLGPAVSDRIGELAGAGMDVARLNFAHGSPAQRAADAARVRETALRAGRPIAVMADLAGPKIRLGELDGGTADLTVGAPFVLRKGAGTRSASGDASGAVVTYDGLGADVRTGDTVLLGDGVAELRVDEVADGDVRATVVRGGTIRSRTGVAIPSERLSIDSLTDKDRVDAAAAIELGVDYVAQSFVRGPADVLALRGLLGAGGPPVIAKIETRPAIDAFDRILDVVDGVMIARGDMGVELPYEEVPIVQKQLVGRALERGIPTIVATQMLESMISAPRPTRAEASDVANAVFDGADAIMLSAETAIGQFPIAAAEAAVRIVGLCEARGGDYLPRPARGETGRGRVADIAGVAGRGAQADVPPFGDGVVGDGVVVAAVALADADPDVDAIGCFTRTGRTARLLAAQRPTVPIVAFTSDASVAARLALVRGVVPRLVAAAATDAGSDPARARGRGLLDRIAASLLDSGVLPSRASAVLVASADEPGSGPTLLELRRLSS